MAAYVGILTARQRVVSVGAVSLELEHALKVRGLRVDAATSWHSLSSAFPFDTRAVLVPFSARVREALIALTAVAWQHDALIVILVRNAAERAGADEVWQSVVSDDQSRHRHGLIVVDGDQID